MRSEKWVWGKICGFKIGDKVRLVCDLVPTRGERENNPLGIPWGHPVLNSIKKGTEGKIVEVIALANLTMYIVDFGVRERNDCWVTDYEIEPTDERDLE